MRSVCFGLGLGLGLGFGLGLGSGLGSSSGSGSRLKAQGSGSSGVCLYHECAEAAQRTNLAICTPVMHGACGAGGGVVRGAERACKARGADGKGDGG